MPDGSEAGARPTGRAGSPRPAAPPGPGRVPPADAGASASAGTTAGAGAPAGELEFRLLGPVQARRGGAVLDLGSPQQRTVACLLLLEAGRLISTERMIAALWGEDPPPRALGALRTYISRLRLLLEPGRPARSPGRLLVSVGDGYQLRVPGEAVDALRFQRAVAAADPRTEEGRRALAGALALWDGEPLGGAVGPYADGERRRLADLRLGAQEASLEGELAAGRAAAAIAGLTALCADHPLREHPRGLLMRALYATGRQAEALAVYADTRRILIDQLGIEPGPELAALHARILDGDPTLVPTATPAAAAADPGAGSAGAAPADAGSPAAGEPPAAPAVPLVPAQLPADIPDFTGRAGLVEELSQELCDRRTGTVVIGALAGIGGVGKTTLAVHTAHRLRPEFPDGQLYADLAGFGPSPVEPATVLGDFLRTLGVPAAEIPDGTDRRAALYRTLLADRRLLVLLDDARDAAQVRALLPGTADCSVLITSRGRMSVLPGARCFDVDVLEEDEALELFAAIAGRDRVAAEPDAARAVLAACSRLPLAVRITASRLAARPGWTVAALADRLADHRRRLDELHVADLAVEATFQLGYDQLTPEQARAFRLLALADGPDLPRASAAALLDCDEFTAEDLAESLVDCGLLDAPAPGRYRYHDLVRLYARRESERRESPAERAAAAGRLLDHLRATVRRASRLLEPGDALADLLPPIGAPGLPLASAEEARAWLAAEHAHLLAAAEQAARGTEAVGAGAGGAGAGGTGADGAVTQARGGVPARPAEAVDLLFAWIWLIEARIHRHDLRRVLLLACEAAGAAGGAAATSAGTSAGASAAVRARARYLLGSLSYWCGDYADAEQELRATLALLDGGPADGSAADAPAAPAVDDPLTRYGTVNTLGVMLSATNRPAEAIPLLDQAATLSHDFGNPPTEARILGNLARAHLGAGCTEQAREVAARALLIARASGSPVSTANTLYQNAIVLRRTGNPAEAAELLEEALVLFRTQQRASWEGLALARLAECHLDTGALGGAVECAEEALALGPETTGAYCQGLAQAALGFASIRTGGIQRGRHCLEEAYAIFSERGVPESAAVLSQLDALNAESAPTAPAEPCSPEPCD